MKRCHDDIKACRMGDVNEPRNVDYVSCMLELPNFCKNVSGVEMYMSFGGVSPATPCHLTVNPFLAPGNEQKEVIFSGTLDLSLGQFFQNCHQTPISIAIDPFSSLLGLILDLPSLFFYHPALPRFD